MIFSEKYHGITVMAHSDGSSTPPVFFFVFFLLKLKETVKKTKQSLSQNLINAWKDQLFKSQANGGLFKSQRVSFVDVKS